MKIDQVSWNVKRHELSIASPVISVAAQKAADEQGAVVEGLALTNNDRPRRDRTNFGYGPFEPAAFRSGQRTDPAPA
jgi:hypothetical protein